MATSLRILILFGAAFCIILLVGQRRSPVDTQGGCGPTSMQALCQCLGVPVTLDELSRLSGGDFSTSSLAEMKSVAQALGLKAEGLEMSIAELRRTRPLGILHTDGEHFVAVVGYTNDGPRVADPVAWGKTSVSVWPYAQLSTRWNGRILMVARLKAADRVAAEP